MLKASQPSSSPGGRDQNPRTWPNGGYPGRADVLGWSVVAAPAFVVVYIAGGFLAITGPAESDSVAAYEQHAREVTLADQLSYQAFGLVTRPLLLWFAYRMQRVLAASGNRP